MQWYGFYKEPPGGVDSPRGIHSSDAQVLHINKVTQLKTISFGNILWDGGSVPYRLLNREKNNKKK